MMKYIAPILILLSFTDPENLAVWVERGEVSTVQRAVTCEQRAETLSRTLTGPVCVRESVAEVVKILEGQHDSTGRFRGVPSN